MAGVVVTRVRFGGWGILTPRLDRVTRRFGNELQDGDQL
jgi:hypothetical protein